MPETKEIWVEYVPLSDFKKYPKNPKLHDLDTLGKSIERFGFNDPVAIDENTGYLVEGHGRIERLEADKKNGKPPPERIHIRKDGEWLVPVLRGIAFTNETELQAYLLAANRLVEVGGWDDSRLATIMKELKTSNATAGIGWSDRQIQSIINNIDPSDLPEGEPDMPDSRGVKSSTAYKQIVLYYAPDEYEEILEKLQEIMDELDLDSQSDVVRYLLEKA